MNERTNQAGTQLAPATLNPFGQSVAPSMHEGGGASAQALMRREAQDLQVQMFVAKAYPRNEGVAMGKMLVSFQRPGLAEEGLYDYSKGGTNIVGLSIRAAEEMSRQWGNMRFGSIELSRGNGISEWLSYAQDTESGTTSELRFFVKHWIDTKQGGRPTKDEREIYELGANAAARRRRVCMLSLIPSDVKAAVETQINETMKANVVVTPETIKKVEEGFLSEYGVTRKQIEKRLQRGIASLTPAQYLGLRRIFQSLKDGMAEVGDFFEPEASDTSGQSAADKMKASLAAAAASKKDAEPKPEPEKAPEPEKPAAEAKPAAVKKPAAAAAAHVPLTKESAIQGLRACQTETALDNIWKAYARDAAARNEDTLEVEIVRNDVRERIKNAVE